MNLFQAIILGIIQGLTEFLPISSTAHLLLAQSLFGWHIPEDQAFSFLVLVQLGTLLSLIVFFWRDLKELGLAGLDGIRQRKPFDQPQARLAWQVILATIPALIAGVLFKNLIEQLFTNPAIAASIRLFMTAGVLVLAELVSRRNRDLSGLTWFDAIWIGLAQVLSIFPGASRSGSTIMGGMTRHLDRPSSARFAFLMAIPVMLAAGAYQSIDVIKATDLGSFLLPLLVGFITAAIVGYLAIRWLMAYLTRSRLYIFAIYCFVLGSLILISSLIG
jgi:undecaprenyl-diphosphatase